MDTFCRDVESASLILLGAGFSAAATDGRMPLMSGFFDVLEHNDFPELFEFVSCMAHDFRTANVEKILVFLDQICTSSDALLDDCEIRYSSFKVTPGKTPEWLEA